MKKAEGQINMEIALSIYNLLDVVKEKIHML